MPIFGGLQVGNPVARKFSVTSASTTSALFASTGLSFYTPTVGDIILDIWVETDVAWNGTTPKMDIGTFVGSNNGLFNTSAVIDLTIVDSAVGGTGLIAEGAAGVASNDLISNNAVQNRRFIPAKVTVANPILAVVSQTGVKGGAAAGANLGSSIIYLVTATPV